MILIELNDVGLRVSRNVEQRLDSPGFAHLERREVTIGEPAVRRYKTDPTRTETNFWHRFGRDDLGKRHKVARFQADLAYLHLEAVWAQAGEKGVPVVFAVPADFRRDQVALLLGMAKKLGIPARAVVDAAVAASSAVRPGRRLAHLDLHLHRTVLAVLEQGEVLSVDRGTSTPAVGWLRVLDAWADAVARVFVQSTRFDPLHDAAVEQRLHDQLAGWAEALGRADEVAVSLEDRGRRFDAELQRSAIIAAARPLYRRLVDFVVEALPDDAPSTLQLTHRVAELPGLIDEFSALPQLEVLVLPKTATAEGVQEMPFPEIDGDAVPYVREKAWWARSIQGEHATALDDFARRTPTHWVHGGVARPIGNGAALAADGGPAATGSEPSARLVVDGERVRLRGAAGETYILNGRPMRSEDPVLSAGDRLRCDRLGLDVTLVAVVNDGS